MDGFNNVELNDFVFAIEIAKEKAQELLSSNDPQVIATLAQTYAVLASTKSSDDGARELREGLNFIIDELQKEKK